MPDDIFVHHDSAERQMCTGQSFRECHQIWLAGVTVSLPRKPFATAAKRAHVIGNKTGEWKVPVGGMGGVVRELEKAARNSGAEMLTRVHLRSLNVTGKKRGAEFDCDGKTYAIEARFVLVNFGRNVLANLLGRPYQPDRTDEGSVFKINMIANSEPRVRPRDSTGTSPLDGDTGSIIGRRNVEVIEAASPIPSSSVAVP